VKKKQGLGLTAWRAKLTFSMLIGYRHADGSSLAPALTHIISDITGRTQGRVESVDESVVVVSSCTKAQQQTSKSSRQAVHFNTTHGDQLMPKFTKSIFPTLNQ
jgi:hypothetical protein